MPVVRNGFDKAVQKPSLVWRDKMSSLSSDHKGVIISCPKCSKKNRIPFGRLTEEATCGSCQTTIPAIAQTVDIPEAAAFDRLVSDSPVPVLVDFWAPWCGPCRVVGPELEKVARQEAGRLVIAKVNTEALQPLAARFSVTSIPMMAVFKGGREIDRTMGSRPAPAIKQFVQSAVAKAG